MSEPLQGATPTSAELLAQVVAKARETVVESYKYGYMAGYKDGCNYALDRLDEQLKKMLPTVPTLPAAEVQQGEGQ